MDRKKKKIWWWILLRSSRGLSPAIRAEKTRTLLWEINVYYPESKQVKILKRTEPKGLAFYPHGIDLIRVKDSLILFVVETIDMAHHEKTPFCASSA